MGQAELDLVEKADWRAFPPRLLGQPIFYPVCNEEYACEIAGKWNAKEEGIGYVTRFDVRADYLAQYNTEVVGAAHHEEYWIPAEDLDNFNAAIVGKIEVVRTLRKGS